MTAAPIVVGITGASGALLARRCVESLQAHGREAIVVCTPAGALVWQHELGEPFKDWVRKGGYRSYAPNDVGAPIASGTFPVEAMTIVPCSMDAVATIAHGISGNLLERAADVTLKEGRRLVIVPRETPLSVIHLTNLLTLANLGVRIVPPMPHFYARPKTIEQVVDHIVGRVLVALGLEPALPPEDQYGEGIT